MLVQRIVDHPGIFGILISTYYDLGYTNYNFEYYFEWIVCELGCSTTESFTKPICSKMIRKRNTIVFCSNFLNCLFCCRLSSAGIFFIGTAKQTVTGEVMS